MALILADVKFTPRPLRGLERGGKQLWKNIFIGLLKSHYNNITSKMQNC
jgi:hypothetical protein